VGLLSGVATIRDQSSLSAFEDDRVRSGAILKAWIKASVGLTGSPATVRDERP